jgi:hypothetical protein
MSSRKTLVINAMFPAQKKSKYIPVVLSRPEIDTIISHVEYPFDIVVSLLYGCGLRLF